MTRPTKPHLPLVPRLGATAALVALLLASGGARAQSSPWFVSASLGFLHDTNFLRLADGQATPAGYTRADTALTSSLAGGFDQMIGRQRLYANATLRSTRLANNNAFDNQGYGAQVGLAWETAQRFSGELRLATDRSLTSFDTGAQGAIIGSNLQTLTQADTVFRVGLVTRLSAELGLGWRDIAYSNPLYESREFHEGYVSTGLRYRPGASSSLGVAVRETRGTYPRYQALAGGSYLANDYQGRYVDLTATYRGGGKTELRARLSSGQTRYDSATQSDFRGITSAVDWIWQATGKLLVETTLQREPTQDVYFIPVGTSGVLSPLELGRVSTGLRTRLTYSVTPKFGLRATAGTTHRSLSQSVPLGGGVVGVLNGSDATTVGSLGAFWMPARWLTFSCDLGHEARRGDAPLSSDMSNTSVSCLARAELR